MKDIDITLKCNSDWKYVEPIVPASQALPQWYKDMRPDQVESKPFERHSRGTIKACPAMFEGMSQGYILPLWTDLYVEPSEDAFRNGNPIPRFSWTPGHSKPVVQLMNNGQIDGLPITEDTDTQAYWLRLDSPWLISTPKGYSTLFIAPFNNSDLMFEPFSGIIHTDIFSTYIKILTLWKGPKDFKGIIKAGTPMLQIIPFKRESFQHHLGTITSEEDREEKACSHAVSKLGFSGLYRKLFTPFTKASYK